MFQPNRVVLMDKGSLKERAEEGLGLLRNNQVRGQKVVIKLGEWSRLSLDVVDQIEATGWSIYDWLFDIQMDHGRNCNNESTSRVHLQVIEVQPQCKVESRVSPSF
jgi:hypothetical protein